MLVTPEVVTSSGRSRRTSGVDLLTALPAVPVLLVVGLLAVLVAALRRALALVALVVVLLLVASMVLHWPPPALAELGVVPGRLPP